MNPETPRRSALAAAFFAILFIILSVELLADQRTYIQPPTPAQAQEKIDVWLFLRGKKNKPENWGQIVKRKHLIQYMSSSGRYQTHRIFLGTILLCYLACAFGLWRRYPAAYKLAVVTFSIKIVHSIFFLWMGYKGRVVSAALINAPRPPLLVFGENEIYNLLGIFLSLILIGYFYWVHRKSRRILTVYEQ